MPTGTLTYSLASALNEINRIIEENEVSVFSDFITQCIDVSFTDDCANMVVKDLTDYTDVNTDNLTMTITVVKKNCYERDITVVANTTFTAGSTVMFTSADGIADGSEYCVTINSSYSVGGDTYTNENEICRTLDCCKEKVCSLRAKIKCKMAQVGCRMKDNMRMGKKVSNWQTVLYKLTLMLNLLDSCGANCDDYESVLYEYNGLKNVNC